MQLDTITLCFYCVFIVFLLCLKRAVVVLARSRDYTEVEARIPLEDSKFLLLLGAWKAVPETCHPIY